MKIFKDLYQYRELLKSNVKKEIRGKYKGSFLGVLWSFINPLLSVLVYAIVFPLILKNPQPNYVVFLIIGIVPWNFFVTVMNQGVNTVVINGNIIKKVYFPREILPISVVTSGLVNFFISCLIILGFIVFGGMSLSPVMLLAPVIAIIQFILSLGLLLVLSAINVYIRDVEYIVNFIMTLLFYATPILYSSELFKNTAFAWIMNINPLAHIINAYRDVFYYQQLPNFSSLGIVAGLSLVTLIIGYNIFKKLEKGFAEEL